jgi:WhiB family transcriptional regulator, redox-sensing transcriptional regulator
MAHITTLAVPRHGAWDWQHRAACRGADTRIFYHPENERGPSRRHREEQAKQICRACPVLADRLVWALTTREPYGVWGGLSAAERWELLASAPE